MLGNHYSGTNNPSPPAWQVKMGQCYHELSTNKDGTVNYVPVWIINEDYSFKHCHPTIQTELKYVAAAAIRDIPPDILVQAKTMFSESVAMNKIYKICKKWCENQGMRVLFTRDSLYKKIALSAADRQLDASHTSSCIRSRNDHDGYGRVNDKPSTLDAAFWIQDMSVFD